MNKVLSVRIRAIHNYQTRRRYYEIVDKNDNYITDTGECIEYIDVPISDFVLRELEIEHKYSLGDLAKSVYDYGAYARELLQEIEKRNLYNSTSGKLYE